jgi:hypothetical protein
MKSMKNRGTVMATLVAFLLFSWSCVSYKVKREIWRDLSGERQREAKIVKVKTNSGELVDFSGGQPARMTKAGIVGSQRIKGFQVEKTQVKEIRRLDDRSGGKKGVLELTTLDGKNYTVLSYKEKGGMYICDVLVFYTIPPAEADIAWIKSVNKAMTAFLNALWLVPVVVSIGFLIGMSQGFSLAGAWY